MTKHSTLFAFMNNDHHNKQNFVSVRLSVCLSGCQSVNLSVSVRRCLSVFVCVSVPNALAIISKFRKYDPFEGP